MMQHKCRALFWVFAIFATCFASSSEAGGILDWFQREPKNFDECILQNMRGVTSDKAAIFIRSACREKFPEEKIFVPQPIPSKPRNLSLERLSPSLKVISTDWIKNNIGMQFLRVHAQNNTGSTCAEIRFYYEPTDSECTDKAADDLVKGPLGEVVSGTTTPKSQFFVIFPANQIIAPKRMCYIVYCYGYK